MWQITKPCRYFPLCSCCSQWNINVPHESDLSVAGRGEAGEQWKAPMLTQIGSETRSSKSNVSPPVCGPLCVNVTCLRALPGVGNQVFPASVQTQRAWWGKLVREMLTVSHLPGANTQWEGSVLWLLFIYCTAMSCFTAQSSNYHLWRKQQLPHSSTHFFRSQGPIKWLLERKESGASFKMLRTTIG